MASATTPPPAPSRRARRRWWRRIWRATVGLIVVVVLLAIWVVRNLDRPVVKRRVQALVRAQAGVELDYGETHVAIGSGFDVVDVRVLQPPGFAAPHLLRIGAVHARWSPSSLFGSGSMLEAIQASDVDLQVVRAGDGSTSLSGLGGAAPSPGPPAPAAPLSRALADLLAHPPAVGRLRVGPVSATFADEGTHARFRLSGLAAEAVARREAGAWHVALTLGSRAAPLELTLAREQVGRAAGEAVLTLAVELLLSPRAASAHAEGRLVRQTLTAEKVPAELLALEAALDLDPAHARAGVRVQRLDLLGSALIADGELELPDAGAPELGRADAKFDLVRLLALVPADLLPVELGEGRLAGTARGVRFTVPPVLAADGHVELHGTLSGLRARAGDHTIHAAREHVLLRAVPSPAGVHAQLELSGDVRVAGPSPLVASGLDVTAEAELGPAPGGAAQIRFDTLAGAGVNARAGRLHARVSELKLDPQAPLASRGRVDLEGRFGALELSQPGTRVAATDVGLTAHTRLTGSAPYQLELAIPVGELRVAGARGPLLAGTPARVVVQVTELRPDAARPLATTAKLTASLGLGALTLKVTANKREAALDYRLDGTASSLTLLRRVLPQLPVDRMTLALAGSGQVERLDSASPSLTEELHVKLGRPGMDVGGRALGARAVALDLSSSGSTRRLKLDAAVSLTAFVIDDRRVGDGRAHVAFTGDMVAHALSLRFDGEGAAGPTGALTADVSWDANTRAIVYRVGGRLARLGALQPLTQLVSGLEGLDAARLALELRGQGALGGLVAGFTPSGAPRFSAHPFASLHGHDASELRVEELHFADDAEHAVDAASFVVRSQLEDAGGRRSASLVVEAPHVEVEVADHRISVDQFMNKVAFSFSGDPLRGDADLTHEMTVKAVAQDYAPIPPADVRVRARAHRGADGVVRVSELELKSERAGTTFTTKGAVDLDLQGRRPSLSFDGELTQRLEPLSFAPGTFTAQGGTRLALRVDSGDLELYHVNAVLHVDRAWLAWPARHVRIDELDGEIPITEDLVLGAGGVELVGRMAVNSYPQLRFADQHPFLSGRSFVSAHRVATDLFAVGPLAGNLRIERNLVSLDQLEMAVHGGRVTGQCMLDWRGADSTLQMRVRASHVEASKGGVKAPFDGNAALTLGLRTRSIEGRAEILHIGRQHLLDLIDLYDPHRSDTATNRVRRALALGYPDRVRVLFDRGFASLLVTFGGLGKLIRVDEIRGIPTGPLIDKYLGALIPDEDPE